MRIAWGLIVVAADLFHFGGLLFVRAETCADGLFTCAANTGPIYPADAVTTCSAASCTSGECCVAGEKCQFGSQSPSEDCRHSSIR